MRKPGIYKSKSLKPREKKRIVEVSRRRFTSPHLLTCQPTVRRNASVSLSPPFSDLHLSPHKSRMKRWLSVLFRRRLNRSSSVSASAATDRPRGTSALTDQSPETDIQIEAETPTMENVLLNFDFSEGLTAWNPNSCHAYVAADESGYINGVRPNSGSTYAIVTKRTQSWQGLEQNITDKITLDTKYIVSAYIRVAGEIHEPTTVVATLKLKNHDNSVSFLRVGMVSASKEDWVKLEGSFSLQNLLKRVVFFLEGPPPGIDLLIDSVTVSYKREPGAIRAANSSTSSLDNIIMNHDFSDGIKPWRPNCCHAYVASDWSGFVNGIKGHFGDNYAFVTKRTQQWQGLEQDITEKVKIGVKYFVFAHVRVNGEVNGPVEVRATIRLENFDSTTNYLFVGRVSSGKDNWEKLEGSFTLNTAPKCAVFYLEGPPPTVDLLIDCVKISCAGSNQLPEEKNPIVRNTEHESITQNPQFEHGLNHWTGRGCKILRNDSFGPASTVRPLRGKHFAVATQRWDTWNGIEQEITSKLQRKAVYTVKAIVRIGGSSNKSEVRITIWYKGKNGREEFKGIAKGQVSDKEWVHLEGKLLLFSEIQKAIIFLEGPPAGTDILVNSFTVARANKIFSAPPPSLQNIEHGVNLVHNTELNHGLSGWAPLGSCSLNVCTESPHMLPHMHPNHLAPYQQPLCNRYILCTRRTETWMGPSQVITDKLKLHLTYQVSAWVRVGPGGVNFQKVNVALSVDEQWVNGGTTDAGSDRWYEVRGSFRLEKKPSKVTVYVQGPAPGVDLCVMGLRIFPNNRKARFEYLKQKTDKVRKRDVILRFHGSNHINLTGALVKINQTYNSFPFGTCIGRYNIDHEDLADFFIKNFNWAVFENELKWYWTEAERGKINYNDSDYLLDFCQKHNKQVRSHCIFWEVEDSVQPWIKSVNNHDLKACVDNRLKSLLTRYRGKFRHHDVNNEMLHGSFFKDRLGADIWAYMFREAQKLDPSAVLFVNDYNVEDGCDPKSTPEKYIEQILELQERGANVGGIGVQGHITNPIGEIICDSFDKLSILGIPIWITELDVTAANEHVRADDLEVVLREAFAHPSVEGIVFWGFWELFMWRENAHLVDADGSVNEAGRRFLELKKEWLSNCDGNIDATGCFGFRGYHGGYNVEVILPSGERVCRSFVVDKGETPLVLSISL
ncbi:glycosyl hydrolase family 10 protein / carbohydrate-binding domain-containing protein [Rhynchospora pubera]|uniref:Glycosyl hydrolase family 10 protein / carbohydrate-binding domain-containing protein n=1 Tax=Rhynchospora pubera TaxID=906938 RepID=A0AAV8D7K8_9POAL|nr:glycosyl hydrolase family 10 protein / carbohydrate-binding domain-containing protein [Rhynchospora pubera]